MLVSVCLRLLIRYKATQITTSQKKCWYYWKRSYHVLCIFEVNVNPKALDFISISTTVKKTISGKFVQSERYGRIREQQLLHLLTLVY